MTGAVPLLAACLQATTASAGLDDLARAGQWHELLAVASRRGEQLPLNSEEALIAAYAARVLGKHEAEEVFLVRASGEGALAEVARLELAELVVGSDAERAATLVVPLIRGAPSYAMRAGAVDVAVEALEGGLGPESRGLLEAEARMASRSHRRRLELALLTTDGIDTRERLGRLLASSTRDLVAMQAARLLQRMDNLSEQERWWVAQTLYRHALYREAEPILESLGEISSRSIPGWNVAYLRGRCAFRQGRWEEAAVWYSRSVQRARSSENRADLEVHLARSLELDGRLEEAVTAAQRAVRSRPTDDRRLFLARLRLRLDQPEFARQGVSRIKGRTARARGQLLLALYEISRGNLADARRLLDDVRRWPWSGPAAVLAARLALDDGEPQEALAALERSVLDLDPYWSGVARSLMAELPEQDVRAWRARSVEAVESTDGRVRERALARWARLEFGQEELNLLRKEVVRALGLESEGVTPPFEPGVAADLWRLGLTTSALRWDPTVVRPAVRVVWGTGSSDSECRCGVADGRAGDSRPGVPADVEPDSVPAARTRCRLARRGRERGAMVARGSGRQGGVQVAAGRDFLGWSSRAHAADANHRCRGGVTCGSDAARCRTALRPDSEPGSRCERDRPPARVVCGSLGTSDRGV